MYVTGRTLDGPGPAGPEQTPGRRRPLMPDLPAVTMQDLELELAELLPPRETLYRWSGPPRYTGGPVSGPPRYTGGPMHAGGVDPGGPMGAASQSSWRRPVSSARTA